MTRFTTLALLLACGVNVAAQGTRTDYERAARLREQFAGKVLNVTLRPAWYAEGAKFWYTAEREGDRKEYIVVDCVAGTKSVVPQGDLPKDVQPEAPSSTRRPPREPLRFPESKAVSPDGRYEAFVRDHNVWLRRTRTKSEEPLSTEGSAEDAYSGEFYWSPDSRKLAALRTRHGGSRKVTLVESSPRDQLQPKLMSYDYLKPGDAIPQSKPHLFDVAAKKEIPLDDKLFGNPWSLDRIRWDADSARFTFLYNQRGHQVMRVLAVDAGTGAVIALINEECKTFFDYSNKTYYRWLDSGDILWMSERSGYNHLYRIDGKTGEVKNAVTKGNWVLRAVDRIDESKGKLWIRTLGYHPKINDKDWDPFREDWDPYGVTHASINLDGSGFKLLHHDIGSHELLWNPQRTFFIDTFSTPHSGPVHDLCDAEGKTVLHLEKADLRALKTSGWRAPEPFLLPGRDGKTPIYGVIYRPSQFDPQKKYPILEHIYAGPHSYFVNHRFQTVPYEQSMAELGFIVVKMDGMGTNWRSKAFHDVSWKNLSDAGFPDRIAVIKTLAAKHPEMDLSKGVGIYGGSAGGQSALAGLLHHGDFYTVGVADCGCHDNRMDKIWWNEAWMGWPVGPHYAEQSNVTNAHKLKGKLLLIVGEKDNNVDPASTMQVVNALVKANKDFDLLVLPGVGHGAAETPYGSRRRADFFVRHLLGVEPRK